MKSFWMVTAGVSIAIAAVLMWRHDFNTAFLVALVGVVAWFLNYRIQMKRITATADAERDRELEQNDEEN